MIGTPDCLCVRLADSAPFMVPGEEVEVRTCCMCGFAVAITEVTVHWEKNVERCHRRLPIYGCDACFEADGTQKVEG